ncbi:KAT8 regulatory NSL complex subunit 3-like protein [Leptotrombidium deliense]|uniref:KAT8 regulatory NSL complex subunit 3-like protein n=1 Tax=Leptotrombidium deliense TaxID=299467 RepID=A0A443SRP4_9ACAR|nr:KAT8 regulatory NSL complex subunit 3-like protein [Leptotrombidium deliense]
MGVESLSHVVYATQNCGDTSQSALMDNTLPLLLYLRRLSGQERDLSVVEVEHSYSKSWNVHPDPNIKSRPARFLFMSNFPKHVEYNRSSEDDVIDVDNVESSPLSGIQNPFLVEVQQLQLKPQISPDFSETSNIELQPPNRQGWTSTMVKVWTKALKILQNDRLSKLTFEGLKNELILKRNLMEQTCNKFRQLFASVGWDTTTLNWLHSSLNEHVSPIFLVGYHEAMQCLRQKLPTLVDKFYTVPKTEPNMTRSKTCLTDPILSVLNNHKPKRISGSPLFLIVPNGPQIPHSLTSQRMKHWNNLFGSLGKVITVTVNQKPLMRASNCLHEIRIAVRDKIKECKTTFNEGRPLILVGFGASSLIAAHCALNNAAYITATICLGFPLTGVNGFRGDLDDPLLESTVPTLFVIGQNSTMSTLDDMEDFRERITKTETGLVVVGGANDRLIVCNAKKRFTGISQAMVDRSICDEISDFVNCVINPNHVSSDTHLGTTSSFVTFSGSRGHSSSRSNLTIAAPADVTAVAQSNRTSEKSEETDGAQAAKKRCIEPETPASQSVENRISALPDETNKKPEPVPSTSEESKDHKTQTLPEPTSTVAGADASSSLYASLERHYGWSYGVSEVPTVISSGNTRTRHIRAPKQLDM